MGHPAVYLREILLGNPDCPLLAEAEGAGGVGHVRALDQHAADGASVFNL